MVRARKKKKHRRPGGPKVKFPKGDTHYINLWLSPPGTRCGSVTFRLDNEVYVRVLHWMERRPELRTVTAAIRAMVRKMVVYDGKVTLMEAFDEWRVRIMGGEGEFADRPKALRWVINRMLAKG